MLFPLADSRDLAVDGLEARITAPDVSARRSSAVPAPRSLGSASPTATACRLASTRLQRYWADMSEKEITRTLGASCGTVISIAHRALCSVAARLATG